jgi:hypothetical protein
MLLQGLIIAVGGFLFIFSPGLPLGVLVRRSPVFNRELIYWGIGLFLAALLPSLFIQSLLRQLLAGGGAERPLSGGPAGYILTLLSALIAALILQLALLLALRRRPAGASLEPDGLALGFGVGLVAQVFTGLALVGAGFRLMFGDVSAPILGGLAQASLLDLLLGLLPLILYRPALLVVSAVQGVLVARSLREGAAFFWLAALVGALFAWLVVALQLALGAENPGQFILGISQPLPGLLALVFYLAALWAALRWLSARMAGWQVRLKSST